MDMKLFMKYLLLLTYCNVLLLVDSFIVVGTDRSYLSRLEDEAIIRRKAQKINNEQQQLFTLQSSTTTMSENSNNNNNQKRKKKKKKNKYEKFSKVSRQNHDPLEALMVESEMKNQQLIQEQEEKQKQRDLLKQQQSKNVNIPPLPKLEFPDTKHIDPYDPQTFGYIEVGQILGAHGVYGWIKIRCTTDFHIRLTTAGIRHIKLPNKRAPRQIILLDGKHRHDDVYLVQLENILTRDDAQKLRGSILYVREEQKDENNEMSIQEDDDEYLVSDLVGLEVFLVADDENDNNNEQQRKFVGIVAGIVFADDFCSIPGLGHDYIELTLPRGVGGTNSLLNDELVLIPMVKEIVPYINIKEKSIYINPPIGLLDLTYIREEKTRIKGFLPSSK